MCPSGIINKEIFMGWSQDGGPGGCGIRISAQPGTAGGPWIPKGTEEPPVTG